MSALVSEVAKFTSGIDAILRCGFTKFATSDTATCEWTSIVMEEGRIAGDGLPCDRAAVGPKRFQTSLIPRLLRQWKMADDVTAWTSSPAARIADFTRKST
jgi:hypothetical protein